MCICETKNKFVNDIEDIIRKEAIKRKFDFVYSIIPGMMLNSSTNLQAVQFDGVNVQFLIRLPDVYLKRSFKTPYQDLDKIKELVQNTVNELYNDVKSKMILTN